MTPIAHTSQFGPTAPDSSFRASGGRNFNEPGLSTSEWTPRLTPAIPKSIIFISRDFFFLKSIFSNLRSLCMRLNSLWQ